jgi:hypothetical protein
MITQLGSINTKTATNICLLGPKVVSKPDVLIWYRTITGRVTPIMRPSAVFFSNNMGLCRDAGTAFYSSSIQILSTEVTERAVGFIQKMVGV